MAESKPEASVLSPPKKEIVRIYYQAPSTGNDSSDPILTQPRRTGNDGIATKILNCPRGLECLATIDRLTIKQEVEVCEAITRYETNNQYKIRNRLDEDVFSVVEDTPCWDRNCGGPNRPFEMDILDLQGNGVMHLSRLCVCCTCCIPCCVHSIEVSAPPGRAIGYVEQEWGFCEAKFAIKNQNNDTVLRIRGPDYAYCRCGTVEFQILSLDGAQIGRIKKHWSGCAQEICTDADLFTIEFPMDLDVRTKAILLGSSFLIDMMYFEG